MKHVAAFIAGLLVTIAWSSAATARAPRRPAPEWAATVCATVQPSANQLSAQTWPKTKIWPATLEGLMRRMRGIRRTFDGTARLMAATRNGLRRAGIPQVQDGREVVGRLDRQYRRAVAKIRAANRSIRRFEAEVARDPSSAWRRLLDALEQGQANEGHFVWLQAPTPALQRAFEQAPACIRLLETVRTFAAQMRDSMLGTW